MKEGVAAGLDLEYNWNDKLREATYDSTNTINLKYDAFGNRIYKESSVSGQTTKRKYIVDVVGKLPTILLEIEPGGDGLFGTADDSIGKTYMYANSQIIAQYDGDYDDAKYFYLHDRLGSVRQVIDTAGNVNNFYSYDPFGKLFDSETEETVTNPFMFTGQWFDSEIGQYYLRARMYDPVVMRFTGRDPVTGKFTEPMTLHKYLYCQNDPINMIDIIGLDAYYITGGFMASLGYSLAGQTGIVWDDKGQWGVIGISQYGVGSLSASMGIQIGITNASDIFQLRGLGWGLGAGVSSGFFGVGAEIIWGGEEEPYRGIKFNIGVGISSPVEAHIHKTQTYVDPAHIEGMTFEEVMGTAAAEAFYKSTTYGEARFVLKFMLMTDVNLDVLQ